MVAIHLNLIIFEMYNNYAGTIVTPTTPKLIK